MLKLSLMVGMHAEQNYGAFRNSRLRQLLNTELESFALETDEVTNPSLSRPWPPENLVERFTPLRSVFPVGAWKHIRHFGLSRLLVTEDGLLDLLRALRGTFFVYAMISTGGAES
ncbi:hypothetical protein LY78DRAFT_658957 [Colletotrichum sublineola]|nr:hypothetical protein LY78DRAFT_658957 [Colletotrichum sublineola]